MFCGIIPYNPLVECQTRQNRGHGSESTDSAQTRQSEIARASAWDKINGRVVDETELVLHNFVLLCVLIEKLRRQGRPRRFSKWK